MHGRASASACRPARPRRHVQLLQARQNPERPTTRRHQVNLATQKSGAFRTLVRPTCRNGSTDRAPVRVGARGGRVVHCSTGKWNREKGGRAGDARVEMTTATPARRALQPGSMASITQRKRCDGHGYHALGSMAGLHRGKEGPLRRDLSSPRWPWAEAQASVKRWSTW
jgi:hypothetical protein